MCESNLFTSNNDFRHKLHMRKTDPVSMVTVQNGAASRLPIVDILDVLIL